MESSETTISTKFFDNLWPLILDHNKCDIQSSNTIEHFVPQQKFDHMWAHELLASKNYKNYETPRELSCKTSTKEQPEVVDPEDEIEQLAYRGPHSKILPLDQQLAMVQQNMEIRQKLANDFANREFPWYIQRPSYDYDFQITDNMKKIFKQTFEYEILKNIQRNQCHLMIVDVATSIPLRNLECWLKFSPYVAIIMVIHDKQLYGKVTNFNYVFHTILMEEYEANTCQEELNRSLELGVNKAKELFLYEDAGQAFAFVFSNTRGICIWDKFKILKEFC
ncbi:uncharacterized protein LOC135955064 [Calliphora vicina]|uniref:uncharacterized protein LOC135955064 n=1 Tax=Calliphora vicina TaxID=7373 RepID=UPI00325A743F